MFYKRAITNRPYEFVCYINIHFKGFFFRVVGDVDPYEVCASPLPRVTINLPLHRRKK